MNARERERNLEPVHPCYSMRATPVDNDGVTLPTHVCSVAFITEDAKTAALT